MQNKKVLLINTNLIKPSVAPIGLDYLGSHLEDNGFLVELLDLNFSGDIYGDIQNTLKKVSYIAIGLTVRNTDDCYYLSQHDFLPGIKEIYNHVKKNTDSPIILGGGGFSLMPLDILEDFNADHGIAGDGENTFLELLDKLKAGEKSSRLVKDENWSLEHCPPGRRDIVENERYFKDGGMGSIETRRGCNRSCIYCADPVIKGCRFRTRPIETVICEIKNLLEKGVDVIHFCDSEFNLPIIYSKELLKAMIANRIGEKLRWYAYMSPEYIDEEFTGLLKSSGCEGINFGIDSTSPEILSNLGRNHGVEDLIMISRLFKKHHIKFMFDLLLGGPGENRRTIRETIETVKKLDPTCTGISYGIRVYPGTKIAETVKDAAPSQGKQDGTTKRSLYGNVRGNKGLKKPVFFISPEIGESLVGYTNEVVAGDERFFIGATENEEKNYNYNENKKLQDAIKRGHRGAYWDILVKIC